jgi:hypothetical protein
MFKNKFVYVSILLLCFILLGFVEYLTPKPINWKRTYSKDDKIPYGSYLVYELLPQLFGNKAIIPNNKTFYELAQEGTFDTSEQNDLEIGINFILLNENFAPNQQETSSILDIADKGGIFFIASQNFGGTFADTLGIVTSDYGTWFLKYDNKDEKVNVNLVNPNFNQQNYNFYEHTVPFVFKNLKTTTLIDLKKIKILGQYRNEPNFIYMPYGNGGFYLHTCPLVFTNYNMLSENNHEYIATAFSYLPKNTVVWDEYYKTGRTEAKTPLRFILQNESLKYAWWIFIASVILFMVFKSKRTQRIMPIMKLPQNTTLDFTQTIGNLYYQRRDDANLANKKIIYFLEHIRSNFHINTNKLDNEFIENLSMKSGFEANKLKRIFGLIADVQRYNMISEIQLIELSRWIDDFYDIGK